MSGQGGSGPTLDFNPIRRSSLKVLSCPQSEVKAELQVEKNKTRAAPLVSSGRSVVSSMDASSLLRHYKVAEPGFSSLFTNVNRKRATS